MTDVEWKKLSVKDLAELVEGLRQRLNDASLPKVQRKRIKLQISVYTRIMALRNPKRRSKKFSLQGPD